MSNGSKGDLHPLAYAYLISLISNRIAHSVAVDAVAAVEVLAAEGGHEEATQWVKDVQPLLQRISEEAVLAHRAYLAALGPRDATDNPIPDDLTREQLDRIEGRLEGREWHDRTFKELAKEIEKWGKYAKGESVSLGSSDT